MFIGESIESPSPAAIDPMMVVMLVPAFAYVTGMFLALKRERAAERDHRT